MNQSATLKKLLDLVHEARETAERERDEARARREAEEAAGRVS